VQNSHFTARLICLGWPGTEAYNGAVAFLQLQPSFRPRFSKYPKPNRGIGRDSLKTGAKEGFRPRSIGTRSQKVAGSQGIGLGPRRPSAKRGQWLRFSNNRSHRIYLGFENCEPSSSSPRQPLQLSLSLSPLPLSLSLRCTHCHHTLRPPSTSSGQCNHHATSSYGHHFASLSLSRALSLSAAPTATTPSDHR